MKTAIGYKLFRVSKKYPGKLFPLYVNANTNIPIGCKFCSDGTPILKSAVHSF